MLSLSQLFHKYWKYSKKESILGLAVFLLATFFISGVTSVPQQAQAINPNTAGVVYLSDYYTNTYCVMGASIWGNCAGRPISGTGSTASGGALYQIAAFTDVLYEQQPASGIVWAMDEYNKIRGIDSLTVYAQDPSLSSSYYPGAGFQILSPVILLWQWARNLTYVAYIFILVVISFFILFRQSIGGQTLVTVTNSLPSIILSIILVTLSYAITGLFVDLITVGSNFISNVLITGPFAPGKEFINSQSFGIGDGSQKDIFYMQPDDPAMSVWGIWGLSGAEFCKGSNCQASAILPAQGYDNALFSFVGTIAQGAVDAATANTPIVSNPLLVLLLGISAFMSMIKLFLALLKNYVTIIMYTIISPFIFLSAAIPSKTYGTVLNYIKTLGAASLSFVAVYTLFLFIVIIGRSADSSGAIQAISGLNWAPPLLGYDYGQLGGRDGVLRMVIIYSLLLYSPTLPDAVKEFFNVQPVGEFGSKVISNTVSNVKNAYSYGTSAAKMGK
jgi:hypothetical protein